MSKKVTWVRLPLLESWDEKASDRVTIDNTLTLFVGGGVMIHNRWFRGKLLGLFGGDEIDFPFPGGHAYRKKGSSRLIIRTAGPDRLTLVYEHHAFARLLWDAWYQVVPRID
ncbi:MAG: hypothetical protein KDA37_05255 [Planctomycetales bacterium]|nr:hypothetical protein [Planctomycetales bacterium]